MQHQLVPCCVLQQFRLISEGVASAPTVYSITKSLKHNLVSYVSGSFNKSFIIPLKTGMDKPVVRPHEVLF
ncbi:hypothetical protein JZO73_03620, partial [Enterococcus plantarum]|nr:hypothetical protein [Enterococcus plantarum]